MNKSHEKRLCPDCRTGEIERILDSRIKECPYIDLYKNSNCPKYVPIDKFFQGTPLKNDVPFSMPKFERSKRYGNGSV